MFPRVNEEPHVCSTPNYWLVAHRRPDTLAGGIRIMLNQSYFRIALPSALSDNPYFI